MLDGDVIVVGSGAGGATFAYACAQAGKRVLLLERGQQYRPDERSLDERAMLIDKAPYDDRAIDVNGTPRQLYIGGVLGGGTALYGAALLRPSQDDFHPGKHHGNHLPRHLWDWPVTYDDLEPGYTEAERLFGVSGAADDDFGPLQKPSHGYPNRPLPVHPINERLMAANRHSGLRPFRLPLAIDSGRCLRCHVCAGYICPTNARRASSHLLEQSAPGLPPQVLTNVEVQSLTLDGAGEVNGVRAVDRSTGKQTVYRARCYVLAAGALSSPLLLLRSGIEGTLIGRHYMAHLASPVAIGIFRGRTGADETFVKQVGFPDYYFGTKHHPHKLGVVQSLPVPGPLMTARKAPKLMPRRVQEFLRQRMLPLAGMVEDVPNPANRVWWGPNGRPCLRHRLTPHDHERGRCLGRLMALILKRAGAVVCLVKRSGSVEHMGHQCGTLRFGTRAEHAVLGSDCRLFGHSNVFVVDGSFLPTSLGVGPALTIAANALRVAAIVSREL
jgi:choline dehydrogenase-like flavoprotein